CTARHLANHGVDVQLALTRPNELRTVPKQQRNIYAETGASIADPFSALDSAESVLLKKTQDQVVIIDAVLGYSAVGEVREPEASLINRINTLHNQYRAGHRIMVISLDLPSGMPADGVDLPEAVVHPDIVMTLALPKLALISLVMSDNPPEIVLADIGIPEGVYSALGTNRPFSGHYREPLRLKPGRSTAFI
ncbi:MAG: NAD(P)H-hydrate epimerase, partial [Spirochaetaceae bacterium]|nr:NAD(P)H-hydrate epimerase [Spirochaetaceae bacterium]